MKKELILHPPRALAALICIVAIVVLVLAILMGLPAVVMMGVIAVCGTFALGAGIFALPGSCSIRLNQDGIYFTSFFMRNSARWAEIDDAYLKERIHDGKRTTSATIRYKDYPSRPDDEMPFVSMGSEDLVELLRTWKSEHGANSPDTPPPFTPNFIRQKPNVISKAGIVMGYGSALLALICCPPVFGIVGFFMGMALERKGELHHGGRIKMLSVVLGGLGVLLGMFLVAISDHNEEKSRQDAQTRFWRELSKDSVRP